MQSITNPNTINKELAEFISCSPSPFHAVTQAAQILEENGFSSLSEQDSWTMLPNGKYYTTRNGSSIIALRIGSCKHPISFRICATHTDSPSFKIKHNPELDAKDGYLRLNTESYGGMIDYTWLDRPLTIAGRVMVKNNEGIESRLVHFDQDLFIIPSLAIHMNHGVNKGYEFNKQIDLLPLVSAGSLPHGSINDFIARMIHVDTQSVLAHDLFLANRQAPLTWGIDSEFFSAPKLDDLQGMFACLQAFIAEENDEAITIFASFDNEEVGSNTKQGAMSTFLHDTLLRTTLALGNTYDEYLQSLARSFLASCDNAHALHPNHPEKADEGNYPLLNRGIVVKESANQKYTTDAVSRSAFLAICKNANVPTQKFANRSDMVGGSTLGNLSNIQVSVHAIDIGMPQLAMHSSFETTGAYDTALGIDALRAFYRAQIEIEGAHRIRL